MNAGNPGEGVSLRISVTDRCQMRCVYCVPPQGPPREEEGPLLTFEEIARFVRGVRSAFPVLKVRITGGEPLARPGLAELVRRLSREGIEDLAITTNGGLLAGAAAELKRAGLRRVNVSLDSLDPDVYRALTRGGDVRTVLEGIEEAVRCGLEPVKINAILLRGYNDREVVRLARWALDRRCAIRFLELMPLGCARLVQPSLFVPYAEAFEKISGAFALSPLAPGPGQTSRDYLAADPQGRKGIVGFVSSVTCPFCAGCMRLRLTSRGRLIGCLARDEGRDIRDLLRSSSGESTRAIGEIAAAEIEAKGPRGAFERADAMSAIGG